MKQIFQDIKSGRIFLQDLPVPQPNKKQILIQTHHTLVSFGTEKMLLDFGKANLLQKARKQPHKVKEVMDKLKRDGIMSTVEAVLSKLDDPMPMGYCHSGVVIEVGESIHQFKPGDRVISNGPHADFVCVPENLCCHIPDNISFETAAFTVPGAIALHGIRLLRTTVGENIAVFGLGLLGLMAIQILKSAGCHVLGVDINPQRVEMAKQFGVNAVTVSSDLDIRERAENFSNGVGMDGILITAATPENSVIEQAADIARKRGRIVLVGVVGLNLPRDKFYHKELSFQVACSYGPGRYDPEYEIEGHDYPIEYVRWTEKRNFETILNLMAKGDLKTESLITGKYPLEEASSVYEKLLSGGEALGNIFEYSVNENERNNKKIVFPAYTIKPSSKIVAGVIGAGNFANRVLLPALKQNKIMIKGITSAHGVKSNNLAKRYGIQYNTTDYTELLHDSEINSIFILTRHDQHASMTAKALEAGKSVFVEKPVALNTDELQSVIQAYAQKREGSAPALMVGYNRRFSPLAVRLKKFFKQTHEPLLMNYRINAGFIPKNSWVQDLSQGGGRIVGEICHFVDFMIYLSGSLPVQVCAYSLSNAGKYSDDNVAVSIKFADSSAGTIIYAANGDKSFPKERIEIFGGGRIGILEDFKSLCLSRNGKKETHGSGIKQDKGHVSEIKHFVNAVLEGGEPPIPFSEIAAGTLAVFKIKESLATGDAVKFDINGLKTS